MPIEIINAAFSISLSIEIKNFNGFVPCFKVFCPLARRQEVIGFSRGGDRKSDEFQTATVALRSTAALIISMGIFLITGIGTPFLVFI